MESIPAWIYLCLLFLSLFLSAFAVKISYVKKFPGSRAVSSTFAGTGLWAAGTLFSSIPLSDGWHIFWNQLQICGVILTAVGMAFFAYWYTGLSAKINKKYMYALYVVPTITVIGVFTNPIHGLVWTTFSYNHAGPLVFTSFDFNWLFWLHFAHTYALLLIASLVVIRFVAITDFLYIDQSLAIVSAIVIPLTVNGLYKSNLYTLPFPPTQATFSVSVILVLYSYYRSSKFSSLPATQVVGREHLVRDMNEGAIIVDVKGTIVEINSKMCSYLEKTESELRGSQVEAIIGTDITELDSSHTFEYNKKYFKATISGLKLRERDHVGYLLLVRDVTQERTARQQLEVLNRVLRHNLRNSLTTVTGNLEYINKRAREGELEEEKVKKMSQKSIDGLTDIQTIGRKARQVERIVQEPYDEKIADIEAISEIIRKEADENSCTVSIRQEIPNRNLMLTSRLKIAFEELFENISVHSDNNHADVAFSESKEYVYCSITDSGPPIPEHERNIIEKGSENDLNHASGLGLWLMKWVVEEADGNVNFEATGAGGNKIIIAFKKVEENDTELNVLSTASELEDWSSVSASL